MLKARLLGAALLCAASAAAAADDRPASLYPRRDAEVTYRVTSSKGRGGEVRVHVTSGGRQVRIDRMGDKGYGVLDRARRRAIVVMPEQHAYLELNAGMVPDLQDILRDPDAHFTRQGADTVAGVKCVVWKVESKSRSGSGCVTEDGLVLRANGVSKEASGAIEALSVTYATQDASLFEPPPGFAKLEIPRLDSLRAPRP